MRIGILGCGYVGAAAARQWKSQGNEVIATTRKSARLAELSTCATEVFLIGAHPLSSFIQALDVLLISVAPDNGSNYASTYLETAQQVAEEVKNTHSLKQIIYTSSTSIYGDRNGEWVDEKAQIENLEGNRRVLFETEQVLVNCSSKELRVCILRLGEIYGPGREIKERLRRLNGHPLPGTGDSYTNLSHVEDVIGAVLFALNHSLQGVYNVCGDLHIPRRLFYEQICKESGIQPIQWDPSRVSAHGGNRRISNKKIKEAGFTFLHE